MSEHWRRISRSPHAGQENLTEAADVAVSAEARSCGPRLSSATSTIAATNEANTKMADESDLRCAARVKRSMSKESKVLYVHVGAHRGGDVGCGHVGVCMWVRRTVGGVISMADMSRYREKVTQPLSTKLTLSDSVMDLISPPPPHSGAVVSMILNVLEGYGMTSADIISVNTSTLLHHRVVEAFKFAYAKRTHLGDPAFADVERHVHDMTSAAYVDDVRSQIRDDGVLPRADYHAAGVTSDNHGTSHISVLAPNGDAVAVTSTINYYWGAQVRSESLDIVYNNEMGDFATPDNSGATTPAPSANYIEAGKRPLSSMSPCILVGKDGDVEMVIGGAGGKRIPTAVAYVLLEESLACAMT
ncbi:PREDICTED: gamma-glutamyltranspeptidase 1-like [Priapulus caudatus]|uniref:Gamma-glutamyltranspeptidase 1-like n=1 Tax=Priapulus caudatus TaxID=37621 RepID=A0ABM1DPQ1_PRICU|nr:PREDICTED: gamma-glutamyltranspeptidase 1-like [Priapulus caudatus]